MGGQAVILELWEKALIAATFGFINAEGNRKHQKVVLIIGKKNGKSLLASAIGAYLLIADGEHGPEVYAVATKKDQAKKIWIVAKQMVNKSSALKKRVRSLVNDLICDFNDGVFKPLASDVDTLDGLNVHGALLDEFHQWKNGKALYDIIADGITAREQPLIFMTSTAGKIREDIYDEVYEDAICQLDSYEDDELFTDERTLYLIYELDSREEWKDENCWKKANPGLGTIKNLQTLREKVAKAIANPALVKNLVCKEFNIRETSEESWLTREQIVNEEKFDIKELKPDYAVGGLDLSTTTDLTCATLLFKIADSTKLYCQQMYWLPSDLLDHRVNEDKIPYDKWVEQGYIRLSEGNSINYKDVIEWFQEMQVDNDLYMVYCGYDSWNSRYIVDSLVDIVGKGNTDAIIQGAKTMSAPMKRFEKDLESNKIIYNNNPVTRWCMANAAISIDKNDNWSLVKTSNPRRRIDGVASLLDAYICLENRADDYNTMIER